MIHVMQMKIVQVIGPNTDGGISVGTDNCGKFIKEEEEHILEENSITILVTRHTEDETLGLEITNVFGGISL